MAQYSDPNILFQSRPADVGGSLIAGLQARQQYDMNKQAMGENARLEGERKLQLLATGAANIIAAGGDPAAQSQAFDRFRAIVGRVTGHDVSGLTMEDVAPIVDRVKLVADQQGITLNGLNIEKGKLELQGARDQLQRQQDYYGGGGGGAAVSPGGCDSSGVMFDSFLADMDGGKSFRAGYRIAGEKERPLSAVRLGQRFLGSILPGKRL